MCGTERNTAVLFSSELNITSTASDIFMKKHIVKQNTQIEYLKMLFQTMSKRSIHFLAPSAKWCWTCLQSVWGSHLTFVIISLEVTYHRTNIHSIPFLHVLIYLWFSHVNEEWGNKNRHIKPAQNSTKGMLPRLGYVFVQFFCLFCFIFFQKCLFFHFFSFAIYIFIILSMVLQGLLSLQLKIHFSTESLESHPLDLPVMWRWKHFSWLGLQYRWRGMPFKQHVQEIGGREENEWGGLPRPLWLFCVGEGSRDAKQRPVFGLITPGNGHVHSFGSQEHWDPDRSTPSVCHKTWGMESPS